MDGMRSLSCGDCSGAVLAGEAARSRGSFRVGVAGAEYAGSVTSVKPWKGWSIMVLVRREGDRGTAGRERVKGLPDMDSGSREGNFWN
jgi:hypothetical protein